MARGYSAFADVLQSTVDGDDLNGLWAEHQATLQLQNDKQTALASLFSFDTTRASELVPQSLGESDFEEATEYGVPTSMRSDISPVRIGYPFKWYDLGSRYTFRFLSNATAEQIATLHSTALSADNRLVFRKIMGRVFSPTTTQNEDGTPVLGFWNGVDGTAPVSPDGETFDGSHTHYLVSGGASIVSGDVDELVDTVTHHGFGLRQSGDRIIVFANPMEADIIAGFRVASGARFDSIPTTDAPAFITAQTIYGTRPPGKFNGLTVACGYGDAWVVSDRRIPAGYLVALSTGGPGSSSNPLGFREHVQPSFRGLLQLPGNSANYPLIDSYYVRAFGVGVRQRGAGAVMQVKASGSYAVPSTFAS